MSSISLVDKIVEELSIGRIVAFPTETVYALAVDGTNGSAIESLYSLKQRPKSKSFTVFVENMEAILGIAEVSAKQKLFIEALIPAAATFILQKKSQKSHKNASLLSKKFSGLKFDLLSPDGTIAVRVPDHALSLQIIRMFGGPIVATSANLSGEKSVNDPDQIKKMFKDIYVLDSQGKKNNTEVMHSTVISLLDSKINILRNGLLDEEMLLEIWEDIDNYNL